jgi:hypothetical protein
VKICLERGDEKNMTIKFSELLTSKQIDGMYLMTIKNVIRRKEIKRLIKEMRTLDYQN